MKDLLHKAVEGKGNVVLISGEAGIGKTRLIKELEAYAEPLGIRILEGRCLYESPTPFLPFREALRNVFEVSKSDAPASQKRKLEKAIKQSAPDFMKAIPVVGGILAGTTVAYRTYKNEKDKEKVANLGTLMERDAGLESISDLLVAISKKQPLLLFIDDLHLADTPSLSLFYYLARKVQDSKILAVGAYRPQEVSGALLDIMQMMSRDGLYQKEELERLSQADHFDFMRSMLGEDLGDLVKLVYKETEGNPFFAIETLRLLTQQKILITENGHWKLSRSIEDIEIPPRVHDVIVRRVNALETGERDILDCVSVIGEVFSSSIVEKALGLDRIRLLRILNKIEKDYHLIRSFEAGYKFDHSKIREVLYSEIAPELRKEYHSMIAKSIEETNKDSLEDVMNELAYHYYRSGNAQKGIPYLLRAGEDTREKWAVFEAEKFFSQALEMMGNDERWSEDRTRALEALGDVHAFTGQHEEANECYSKGIASAKDDAARERMRRKTRRKMVLDKNGVKLAYYLYGEGQPTLVFLVAWVWTAEFWQPQVNYFSQNFKMVTIDMRGTGDSDKPAGDYTLDLYADDLDSIIEELHEKNIVLIAESYGASIAIKYITRYPGKVPKLVLVGVSPKFMATDDFPIGMPANMLVEAQRAPEGFDWAVFLETVFPEPGTNYLREWGLKMALKTPPEISLNSIANLFVADLRPLLKKIDMPTLILHGEKDMVFTSVSEGAKYMQENIQGSKNYIIKDAGHFPSITAADKFNGILKEFVTTGKLPKD